MFERNRPYDKVILYARTIYHVPYVMCLLQSQGGGAEIKDDTSNDVPSEDDDDDWEREVDELYQWSQQLSIDDSIPVTPG